LHRAQLLPLPLTVSCFSEIQISFTFLVPARLGSPRKRAIKLSCVCVRVRVCVLVRVRVCVLYLFVFTDLLFDADVYRALLAVMRFSRVLSGATFSR